MIDANLPVALVAAIQGLGHTAIHIHHLSGERTPEIDIWQIAKDANQVIVSKDGDFAVLANANPTGPAVV